MFSLWAQIIPAVSVEGSIRVGGVVAPRVSAWGSVWGRVRARFGDGNDASRSIHSWKMERSFRPVKAFLQAEQVIRCSSLVFPSRDSAPGDVQDGHSISPRWRRKARVAKPGALTFVLWTKEACGGWVRTGQRGFSWARVSVFGTEFSGSGWGHESTIHERLDGRRVCR